MIMPRQNTTKKSQSFPTSCWTLQKAIFLFYTTLYELQKYNYYLLLINHITNIPSLQWDT